LEIFERFAVPVPPPRIHRHGNFGMLARTAAYRKFPRQLRAAEVGREQPAAPQGQLCAVVATAIGYMAHFSQPCFIRGETSLHSVPQIPCTPRQ
jgi:hypothetical protein